MGEDVVCMFCTESLVCASKVVRYLCKQKTSPTKT